MALKSSQPRRNALPKSERLILRTTKVAETPNSCSLGLANTVAIAPVSLLVIATNLVVRATPAIAKIAVRSNVAAPPEAEATPTAAKTAATEAAAAKTAATKTTAAKTTTAKTTTAATAATSATTAAA